MKRIYEYFLGWEGLAEKVQYHITHLWHFRSHWVYEHPFYKSEIFEGEIGSYKSFRFIDSTGKIIEDVKKPYIYIASNCFNELKNGRFINNG